MLTVIATIRVKPGSESVARSILEGYVAPTRAEDGCVNYDLHVRNDNPREFVFHENWTSEAALDAHLQSPHISKGRALLAPHMDGEPDIGRFTRIA